MGFWINRPKSPKVDQIKEKSVWIVKSVVLASKGSETLNTTQEYLTLKTLDQQWLAIQSLDKTQSQPEQNGLTTLTSWLLVIVLRF